MNPITLKIDTDQLRDCLQAIDYTMPIPELDDPDRKEQLSWISLFHEVKGKLTARYVKADHEGKPKVTLKLKYHEAYTLWGMLQYTIITPDCQRLLDQIDQKIA